MKTLSSRLTALTAALAMNGVLMAGVMYLFALQSNTHMSLVAFAKAVVTHQWLS